MLEQYNLSVEDIHMVAAEMIDGVDALIMKDKTKTVFQHIMAVANMLHDKACVENKLFKTSKCRSGCHHCCSLFVDAYPVEAEQIANRIKALPLKDYEIVVEKIKYNAELESLGIDEYIRRKTFCAFLDTQSKRCRVYKDRPINCRNYNSLSVSACKKGVGDPDAGIPRTPPLISISLLLNSAITLLRYHYGITDGDFAPLHQSVLSFINSEAA